VNWRWERARYLRENGSHVRTKKEDPWVLLAIKFQKALSKCSKLIELERLRDKFPGIYYAWQHWDQ
jgi:hypothetical protein